MLVYLDDVLVFSEEEEQHRKDVRRVLQRFRERQMFVKLRKSMFAKQEMQFLGHVVSAGQLRIDEDKLNKLALWESPLKTTKQVRQLMGFLSYYRAFVLGPSHSLTGIYIETRLFSHPLTSIA